MTNSDVGLARERVAIYGQFKHTLTFTLISNTVFFYKLNRVIYYVQFLRLRSTIAEILHRNMQAQFNILKQRHSI